MPSVGDEIRQRTRKGEHVYRLIAIEPVMNRHGQPATVLRWQGTCAVCGAEFMTSSSALIDQRYLVRTCLAHRRKSTPRSA